MKLAFLFPGQGSQSVGMGADIYTKYPAAARTLDEIDELLGYKLTTLCFYGPEESLRETSIAQPALYAVSVATLRVLLDQGIVPGAVAGHSIGEYAAVVASGALTWQEGLTLVNERATAMKLAAETAPGSMAAILGLDAAAVEQICREVESSGSGMVDAANQNGAGQVVISGEQEAVEAAGEVAKTRGAKRVIPLAVSGGFHSRLMKPAADTMRSFIEESAIVDAKLPIVANVTAAYETGAAEIKQNLALQIDHPVLWEQSIQRLLADGYDTFVEVGAGTVLAGLIKRTSKDVVVYTTQDSSSLETTLNALRQGSTAGAGRQA